MSVTLYDPITKKQHTGGWGTPQANPGGRGESVYISTNPATHGRRLTTVNPLQPQGFINPISRMPNQQSTARGVVESALSVKIQSNASQQYKSYGSTSDGTSRGMKLLYTDAVSARMKQDENMLDLARRTAGSLASDLFNQYEGRFFHAQRNGLDKITEQFNRELPQFVANFKKRYSSDAINDLYIREAVEATYEGLKVRANQGTPAEKMKLLWVLPLKVDPAVNSAVITGLSAGVAYYTAPATIAAGTSAPVGSAPIGAATVSPAVSTGGFVADLGIRGAQAVQLSSVGAVHGANVLGPAAGALTSSGFTVGAAGGLISTAPSFGPASAQGANLGLTIPTLSPSVQTQSLISRAISAVTDRIDEAISWARTNPAQAGAAATGAAFTLKRVSEAEDPFSALVNTASSAVGIGPIIPQNPGSQAQNPFASLIGGGASGGGFSRQGMLQDGSIGSSLMGYALLAIAVIVGVMVLRKG